MPLREFEFNIPTRKATTITQNHIKKSEHTTKHNQRKKKTYTILSQNYFQFNNDYYRQEEGLAMGAPSSAILAEIFFKNS